MSILLQGHQAQLKGLPLQALAKGLLTLATLTNGHSNTFATCVWLHEYNWTVAGQIGKCVLVWVQEGSEGR